MSNHNALQILKLVEKEITRLQRTVAALRQKVGRDDLTGLLRREEFFSDLEKRLQGQEETILILLDIDNFKKLNDSQGHQAGDLALQNVAKIIARAAKAGATTGRYGGEEMIIAYTGSAQAARALAEALRQQIEREAQVTVSVGIASAKQANREASQMLRMADEALYVAKRSGKNCVRQAA